MRHSCVVVTLVCGLPSLLWATIPAGFAFPESLIQLEPGVPRDVPILAVGTGSINHVFLALETVSPFEMTGYSLLNSQVMVPANPQQAQVDIIIEFPIPVHDGATLGQVTLLTPVGTIVGTTGWITTDGPNLPASGYVGSATVQAYADLVVVPEPAGSLLTLALLLLIGWSRKHRYVS